MFQQLLLKRLDLRSSLEGARLQPLRKNSRRGRNGKGATSQVVEKLASGQEREGHDSVVPLRRPTGSGFSRRGELHETNASISPPGTYFVTSTTWQRRSLFMAELMALLFLQTLYSSRGGLAERPTSSTTRDPISLVPMLLSPPRARSFVRKP